jgi:UDP-N-acetylmuramoyl-L-alanyl-D-glutamate--2,6-diaminopimelate ligase
VSASSTQVINLSAVLRGMAVCPPLGVANLQLDSRSVEPGDAFVAVAGRSSHGLRHVSSAIARGAVAVLHDPADGPIDTVGEHACAVPVSGLAARLGEIADRAYGSPSAHMELAGITGTNGKTTCAWLYALCREKSAAYLGTLGAGRPPQLAATTHTTADVFTVHRTLAGFAVDGARHVGMEISSHALDQDRIAGVRIALAAFTNLTRDHLDYHGSMDAYGAAKERLFVGRHSLRHAIVNIDDAFGAGLAQRLADSVQVWSVSAAGKRAAGDSFVRAIRIDTAQTGLTIHGESHLGAFEVNAPLVGRFNADNVLTVLGLLLASGLSLQEAVGRLGNVVPPPGRMETFSVPHGPLIVVDYAHTPDALEKTLSALRSHVSGKLYCVVGCGGDRDSGKRPLMAKVAITCADHVVLTDDNPRTEDPDQIIAMMLAGIPNREEVTVERDRALAIRSTAARATAGDVVLVAGKGHEDYQIYGAVSRYFSDRDIAVDLTRVAA